MRGNRADEQWLWSHILFLLPLSLQFHYEKMQAQFFVENASIAIALKILNGKICDEDDEKVCVRGMPKSSEGREGRTGARSCFDPKAQISWHSPSPFCVLCRYL